MEETLKEINNKLDLILKLLGNNNHKQEEESSPEVILVPRKGKGGRPQTRELTQDLIDKYGTEKKCIDCGQILPLTEYYIHKAANNKAYLRGSCKKCETKAKIQYAKLKNEREKQKEAEEKKLSPIAKLSKRAKDMNMSYGEYTSFLENDTKLK